MPVEFRPPSALGCGSEIRGSQKPHNVRRASAACCSCGMDGWEQVKSIRSGSSTIISSAKASPTVAFSVHSIRSKVTFYFNNSMSREFRRNWSMATFFAPRCSHAAGS